ncbi:MAG: hypothetical protein IPO73_15830 [Gemmatimonadetes bacterium]|nr:hypothetical protein [Gemmatimonadota bacterium]
MLRMVAEETPSGKRWAMVWLPRLRSLDVDLDDRLEDADLPVGQAVG